MADDNADDKLRTKVYDDVAKPSALAVGETAGNLVRTALRPINMILSGLNTVMERVQEKLSARFKNVPADKILEPPPHIAGQLLLGYPFVEGEETLREMFIELLAKSMIQDSRESVHPAYAEILKQLTPDEGRLLPVIHPRKRHPALVVDLSRIPFPKPPPPEEFVATLDLDNIDDRFQAFDESFNRTIFNSILITPFGKTPDLRDGGVPAMERAIDNLCRLGIVELTENSLSDADEYKPLYEGEDLRGLLEAIEAKKLYSEVDKRVLEVTAFGRAFMSACLPPATPKSK